MLPDLDPKENLPDEWVWEHPIFAILGVVIVLTLFIAIVAMIVR